MSRVANNQHAGRTPSLHCAAQRYKALLRLR